jgi:ketosteroid isomerase-like protein
MLKAIDASGRRIAPAEHRRMRATGLRHPAGARAGALAAALLTAVAALGAQQPAAPASPAAPAAALPAANAAVKALDVDVEAAFQRADVAFLRDVLSDDFQFWISSGRPLSKAQVLTSYAQPGRFPLRKASSIDVEMHGDVALVNGRLEVRSTMPREYVVCYLRLYQQRGARWQLVSHRTFRERDGFGESCAPVDR